MIDEARRGEWAKAWPLPFVAMLGVAGAGMFSFSSGVFMDEVVREFGWSKSDFTAAMGATLIVSLVMVPIIGRLIDRIGPRRIALCGIVPAALGTASLGLAGGSHLQWWLLCALQALGCIIIVPPVWLAAVVSRFHVSRGVALAVALAGSGLGTALWPTIGAFYIAQLGWRRAYAAMGFSWAAVMLPLALILFHAAPAGGRPAGDGPAGRHAPYGKVVASPTFLCLAASGGLMVLICYGLMIHFVPILRGQGLDLATAAGLAGVAGLCSILGRLATGVLLDLVPSRLFAVLVFLLPVGVCLLLLDAGGALPLLTLAAALLGLAMGAESDILTYVTSRKFDPALFGSLYGVIQAVLAVASIGGSIIAGALYDVTGSYSLFLVALIPAAFVGALLIGMVGDVRPVAVPGGEEVIDAVGGPVPMVMKDVAVDRA